MIGAERERARQIFAPVAGDLLREREDQVERELRDPRSAQVRNGGADLVRVVRAAHPLERGRRERLGAQRHAIDARGPPRARRLGRDVVGIGFEGDLGRVVPARVLANRLEQPGDASPAESRRSSAAEVERLEMQFAVAHVARRRELSLNALDVIRNRNVASHGDGEIAVRAAARAEWDVHVQVARGHEQR